MRKSVPDRTRAGPKAFIGPTHKKDGDRPLRRVNDLKFKNPELNRITIKEKELVMDEEGWADAALGISMLLGLWTIFAPFLLGFRGVLPAVWNGVVVGLSVAFFFRNRVSIGYNQTSWSWCTALFSLWLIVSPFVLSFEKITSATWNDISVGVVLLLLSLRPRRRPGHAKPLGLKKTRGHAINEVGNVWPCSPTKQGSVLSIVRLRTL